MEAPEIAQFARNFSVLVRIQGPDPKGLKMRRNSFHLHQSGKTTISASGLLLHASSLSQTPKIIEHILYIHQFSGAVVVTVASVIHPFLIAEHRNKLTQEFSPRLIYDACIDVLVERKKACYGHQEPDGTPEWLSAKLLALVDVPAASDALLSLVGGQPSWEASWSLFPFNSPQTLAADGFVGKAGSDVEPRKDVALEVDNPVLLANSMTKIAFLGISLPDNKDGPRIAVVQHPNKGDLIIAMGSPFGVLSPMHFYNSISVGNLANCCSFGSNKDALLVADIRSLPGMEGGPVFDKHACLAGILTKPLRQKGSNAEIQFAVSWNAIASIDINCLQREAYNKQSGLIDRTKYSNHMVSSYASTDSGLRRSLVQSPVICSFSLSSLEKVTSSVVLITVGEGSWASGILLNNYGLILTNAHILEPWRFGRTPQLGSLEKSTSHSQLETPLGQQEETVIHLPLRFGNYASTNGGSFLDFGHQSSRRISVRLDFMERKNWYDAHEVYVSKGPLDIALLQLESVPPQLSAIIPELTCPSRGTVVHVIGHGLLGPRSNISSSILSGVISNIVEIPGPIHVNGSGKSESRKTSFPVMLQTTAAVHPGASGGAVINSKGHMVGLVTRSKPEVLVPVGSSRCRQGRRLRVVSNARHGGGTIIPHLNFSIPCAALEPVFMFSETQDATLLEFLDRPNGLLSSVWALVPAKSKKLEPGPETMKHNEGKGSRFSQFLVEKNAEISSLKELIHLKKMRLPSKI